MASKFYVVWVGREVGVFDNWPYTQKLIDKFPQAKYKSFKTQAEAQAAFESGKHKVSTTAVPSNKTSSKRSKPATPSKAIKRLDKNFDLHIFCDGSCDPNPGKASSGVAAYQGGELRGLWYGLYNPNGTNNSAELNALHQSLLLAKTSIDEGYKVQILCDSQYSINCITNWAFSWKKKGWKRKTPGDIKNLDIIQQAHELYLTIQDQVVVQHVKAHIGIEGNELADRMAVYGADKKSYEFARYLDPLDINKILAYKSG